MPFLVNYCPPVNSRVSWPIGGGIPIRGDVVLRLYGFTVPPLQAADKIDATEDQHCCQQFKGSQFIPAKANSNEGGQERLQVDINTYNRWVDDRQCIGIEKVSQKSSA